jgi:hypothetical protein
MTTCMLAIGKLNSAGPVVPGFDTIGQGRGLMKAGPQPQLWASLTDCRKFAVAAQNGFC